MFCNALQVPWDAGLDTVKRLKWCTCSPVPQRILAVGHPVCLWGSLHATLNTLLCVNNMSQGTGCDPCQAPAVRSLQLTALVQQVPQQVQNKSLPPSLQDFSAACSASPAPLYLQLTALQLSFQRLLFMQL